MSGPTLKMNVSTKMMRQNASRSFQAVLLLCPLDRTLFFTTLIGSFVVSLSSFASTHAVYSDLLHYLIPQSRCTPCLFTCVILTDCRILSPLPVSASRSLPLCASCSALTTSLVQANVSRRICSQIEIDTHPQTNTCYGSASSSSASKSSSAASYSSTLRVASGGFASTPAFKSSVSLALQ